MAISPCDNFCVFVLACHSGFLERYFSTIVFVICAEKLKSFLKWLHGQIHGGDEQSVREVQVKGRLRRDKETAANC